MHLKQQCHTLVFESSLTGHGFTYVSYLIPAFAQLGKVTLRTMPQFEAKLALFPSLSDLPKSTFALDTSTNTHHHAGWKSLWYQYGNLVDAIQKHRPDMVFIISGQNLLRAFTLFAPHWLASAKHNCRVELIIHRVAPAYPADSFARHMKNRFDLATFSLPIVDTVHVVDAFAYHHLTQGNGISLAHINMLPHPVGRIEESERRPSASYRQVLDIPVDGRYIGCAGYIDERKGVDLLLDAFSKAPLNDNDRVLLAGRMSASIRKLIETQYSDLVRHGRLICLDRFLSELEFQNAMQAMDVVSVIYPNRQAIASVALEALALHKPLLLADKGWLGWMNRKFELGIACDIHSCVALSAAIGQALDESQAYEISTRGKQLLELHSEHNFRSHVTMGIRRELSLDDHGNYTTWEDIA